MFIDKARIHLQAGKGGDGAVSFHREKYVAAGGPDGGDGGRGGDIVFAVDGHMSTLMDFRYKKKYSAPPGENGRGAKCFGKDGKSLEIRVPRGTLIRDAKTGLIIADMTEISEFTVVKGGRGGWGNSRFATPTRQAPRFAKPGAAGESLDAVLELKLLADVGLVGFPNVGKSTLLSAVSAARPKIANYHFTTLVPNLGVVELPGIASFVMADIPGLIEGASEGAGLGTDFLRHVDRCRLLIHVVDVSGSEGRDPVEDYEQINAELAAHSPELARRPQIVAANKTDILTDGAILDSFRKYLAEKGVALFEISAATGRGAAELMKKTAQRLSELPPVKIYEPEYVKPEEDEEEDSKIEIGRREDGAFVVEGSRLFRSVAMVNPEDVESLNYLQRVLRKNGVFELLEEAGIEDGDIVSINNYEFEYFR